MAKRESGRARQAGQRVGAGRPKKGHAPKKHPPPPPAEATKYAIPEDAEVAFILGPLLIAAGLFYLGTRIGDPADSIASSLKRLTNTVTEVSKKLTDVLDKLDDILSALLMLPKAIQGALDSVKFRESVALGEVHAARLADWSKNNKAWKQHIKDGKVRETLDKLEEQIALAQQFSGGFSGFIQSASLFASWASAYHVWQRGNKNFPCVWHSAFTTSVVRNGFIIPLFEMAKEEKAHLAGRTIYIPVEDRIYDFYNGSFHRTEHPVPSRFDAVPPEIAATLQYPVFMLLGRLNDMPYAQIFVFKKNNDGSLSRSRMSPLGECGAKWRTLRNASAEIQIGLTALADLTAAEQKTLSAFVRPEEWSKKCPE